MFWNYGLTRWFPVKELPETSCAENDVGWLKWQVNDLKSDLQIMALERDKYKEEVEGLHGLIDDLQADLQRARNINDRILMLGIKTKDA